MTDNDILVLLNTSLLMAIEPWTLPPILEATVYKSEAENADDTLFVVEVRTTRGVGRVLRDRRNMVALMEAADGDPPLAIYEELVTQLGALRQ